MFVYYLKIFIALLLFWYFLSGYSEPFFLMSGVISSILSLIIIKRLDCNLYTAVNYNKSVILFIYNFLYYLFWLIIQSSLSTIYVMKKVWQLKLSLRPSFHLMNTEQKTDLNIFLLANSITFTPGTVSIGTLPINKIRVVVLSDDLIPDLKNIDNKVKRIFDHDH